jgi:hypothetical protein
MTALHTLPYSQREHYRARAEECRTIAEMFQNEVTRQKMLDVAAGYEKMADTAEGLDAYRVKAEAR